MALTTHGGRHGIGRIAGVPDPGQISLWTYVTNPIVLTASGQTLPLVPGGKSYPVEYFRVFADITNVDYIYFGTKNLGAVNTPSGAVGYIDTLGPGEWIDNEEDDHPLVTGEIDYGGTHQCPSPVTLASPVELVDLAQFYLQHGYQTGANLAAYLTIGTRTRAV
jgi:hypothetical protein